MGKTSLVITFLTASGGKKSMKFQDAQMTPDPLKVKALANFIVQITHLQQMTRW